MAQYSTTEGEHDSVTVTSGKRALEICNTWARRVSSVCLSPISSGTHHSPPRCLPRRGRVRWRSQRPHGSLMACQSTANSCGRDRAVPAEFSWISRVVSRISPDANETSSAKSSVESVAMKASPGNQPSTRRWPMQGPVSP